MAGETIIISEEQSSTVISESNVVSLVSEGQQGPPGPPGIPEDDMPYAKRIDFVSESVIYRGEATVGTAESAPLWRIRRITILSDGDILEEWADGTSAFTKVWSERATYSFL